MHVQNAMVIFTISLSALDLLMGHKFAMSTDSFAISLLSIFLNIYNRPEDNKLCEESSNEHGCKMCAIR